MLPFDTAEPGWSSIHANEGTGDIVTAACLLSSGRVTISSTVFDFTVL